jgi:membrane dipeptidase
VIVDAHLDIAYNALLNGHDFAGLPPPNRVISRSALHSAGVGLVGATLMCAPAASRRFIRELSGSEAEPALDLFYRTPRDAYLIAQAQVGYYRSVGLRLISDRADLEEYAQGWKPGQLAALLLLEGADAIEEPRQLPAWYRLGLRIVGLAWTRTRYSGGTGRPGGVTPRGGKLLAAMRRQRMILDISHMADRAVADALDLFDGPIMASHSNARALVPGDRQITDGTIRELAARGGVIGISFFRGHLTSGRKAGPEDVVRHVLHVARVAGSHQHVAIGSDLDGGFPASDAAIGSLAEIGVVTDKLKEVFSAQEVEDIMGRNWISFFERALPRG